MIKKITVIVLVALLSACSSFDRFVKEDTGSDAYATREKGQFSNVTTGKIISIKQVNLAGTKQLGTTLGTALGGIAGSSTTDKKYNKEAAIAIGALAGAILGSTIEKYTTKDIGYEFLIETNSGVKAFVDTTTQDLKPGDMVYIIHGSGPVRISKK